MNSYKFRLANVSRIRGLQEAIAKNELLLSLRELKDARRDLQNVFIELSKEEGLKGQIYGSDAHWKFEQQQRFSNQISLHQDWVHTCEGRVEEFRSKWNAASKRCETLARLDARSREDWKHRFVLSEIKELDDISTSRHPIGGRQ